MQGRAGGIGVRTVPSLALAVCLHGGWAPFEDRRADLGTVKAAKHRSVYHGYLRLGPL
jgi:hypothetical protein